MHTNFRKRCKKHVCNVHVFQLSFHFAYHRWWLGSCSFFKNKKNGFFSFLNQKTKSRAPWCKMNNETKKTLDSEVSALMPNPLLHRIISKVFMHCKEKNYLFILQLPFSFCSCNHLLPYYWTFELPLDDHFRRLGSSEVQFWRPRTLAMSKTLSPPDYLVYLHHSNLLTPDKQVYLHYWTWQPTRYVSALLNSPLTANQVHLHYWTHLSQPTRCICTI